MKAVINEKETPVKQSHPWIGKWNGTEKLIVLFYAYESGIVIETTSPDWRRVGENYNNWSEDQFTPFTGSITLSND